MTAPKNYLHPTKTLGLSNSLFNKVTEGTTPAGVRIQQVEARDERVGADFRHALVAEVPLPGQSKPQSITVFGSFDEIQHLAQNLKSNPDKVFSTLRPTGPGTHFHLNRPSTGQPLADLPEEITKRLERADKFFPDMVKETMPESQKQRDDREMKEHQAKFAPETAVVEPDTTLLTPAGAPDAS